MDHKLHELTRQYRYLNREPVIGSMIGKEPRWEGGRNPTRWEGKRQAPHAPLGGLCGHCVLFSATHSRNLRRFRK